MPTAAYVQSALFLVLMAVALFASAGTVAVAGFWLYLAIQLAAIVASFVRAGKSRRSDCAWPLSWCLPPLWPPASTAAA